MILTDTHTHLYLEEFDGDRKDVIENAMKKNIKRFFLPNIDSSTVNAMLALADAYPGNCFPMMGLHPGSVKENYEAELKLVEAGLAQQKFYAVGEIGIDLYWDKTFIGEQKIAFQKQIELAKKHALPIVIHMRDSFNETYEIVEALNNEQLSGIFHCFSGTLEQAKKIISLGGFKLGIGGVLTFKNSGLDKVISEIDIKHLVLETDSPYLAPVPYRGKRNESAYLVNVAEKLAELHHTSVEEVANITTENSRVIFGV